MKAYCQRYAVTECHLFHVFISTERYYEDLFFFFFSRENAGAHKVIAEENKQKNKFLYATEEERNF